MRGHFSRTSLNPQPLDAFENGKLVLSVRQVPRLAALNIAAQL
jgi:hypothetical protein